MGLLLRLMGRGPMHRAHRLATAVWTVLAAGAGLGFVARDLLGLPMGLVAVAWTAGALAGLAAARRGLDEKLPDSGRNSSNPGAASTARQRRRHV
jgi:hypothetical protein